MDLRQFSYDELYNLYFDNYKNQNRQLEYAKAYMDKANMDNSEIKKANAFYLFSLLCESNKAIRYLDSAIAYSKNKNDIKFPAYAYSEKGYFLKKQFRYREAIDNFILAEKEAKKNNIDYYFRVKFSIAVLRSEELGEVEEALQLYKECFNFYKNKEIRTPKYSFDYHNVIFALADAYKALNQSDSATYYNKLGYKESKLTKDEEINAFFILNEGANLILKKNYKASLDSINKALPMMIAHKNQGNTLAAYYYLGKTYEGLRNKAKATQNFIKVDSLYDKTKRITPEFTSGYSFLISYFKEKNDKASQLKYLTKYMYIDSILQKNYKELTKKLNNEYDTPYLLSEKESLIQSLKKDETLFYWTNATLALLIIFIGALGFYQYKLKKTYQSRFEKIINPTPSIINNQIIIPETNEIKINPPKTEDIGIAEELVNQILKKLKHFESKKEFLQPNITIQMLSTTFETNSKYVSKIVNTYKEKTFIQYINDLRIEYAIVQLQKDNKLKKYTINALAAEFGFNGAESFSSAFHKKTGIKPTYFIKELENSTKHKHNNISD